VVAVGGSDADYACLQTFKQRLVTQS